MFIEEDEGSLKAELGITEQRGKELEKIVQTIMGQSSQGGMYGRTSHVLLGIIGKKDLNDVEKVVCTFLFTAKILGNKSQNTHKIKDIKLGNINCVAVTPEGVDTQEMITVLMATIVSMLEQMPKSDVKEFCRIVSISFAKIALTGDIGQ